MVTLLPKTSQTNSIDAETGPLTSAGAAMRMHLSLGSAVVEKRAVFSADVVKGRSINQSHSLEL